MDLIPAPDAECLVTSARALEVDQPEPDGHAIARALASLRRFGYLKKTLPWIFEVCIL